MEKKADWNVHEDLVYVFTSHGLDPSMMIIENNKALAQTVIVFIA